MSNYGMMCGIDDAIEWLQTKTFKADDMAHRTIERLKYVRDKDVGVKPRFHKGHFGKKYDTWTCGHCGAPTKDGVGDTFCRNCGYRILWDNPRCLTGWNDPVENSAESSYQWNKTQEDAKT